MNIFKNDGHIDFEEIEKHGGKAPSGEVQEQMAQHASECFECFRDMIMVIALHATAEDDENFMGFTNEEWEATDSSHELVGKAMSQTCGFHVSHSHPENSIALVSRELVQPMDIEKGVGKEAPRQTTIVIPYEDLDSVIEILISNRDHLRDTQDKSGKHNDH